MKRNSKVFLKEKGIKLTCFGIPPLAMAGIQKSFETDHPKPQAPTYEFDAFGGEVIIKEHDETSLTTDEEKEAYQTYQDDLAEWSNQLNNRLLDFFFVHGADLEVDDEITAEWDEMLSYYTAVPQSKIEKKLVYLKNFVLVDKDQVGQFTKTVMALTGVEQESLAAAEALF